MKESVYKNYEELPLVSERGDGGEGAGRIGLHRVRADARTALSYSENWEPNRSAEGKVYRMGGAEHRRCNLKYKQYPKRDAVKNYFPLPNEIFMLGLCTGEISIYSYLLFLENRKTFQCWPSYKTIGKAVDMSQNTVRKYVMALEEKALIRTEPTTVFTKSGQKRNGSLLYTIHPIQGALKLFYERQMAQAELAAQRQHTAERLAKFAPVGPCEPLCGVLEDKASPSPTEGKTDEIDSLWDEVRRTKEKAG